MSAAFSNPSYMCVAAASATNCALSGILRECQASAATGCSRHTFLPRQSFSIGILAPVRLMNSHGRPHRVCGVRLGPLLPVSLAVIAVCYSEPVPIEEWRSIS